MGSANNHRIKLIFSFNNKTQIIECLNDELFESIIKRYCRTINFKRDLLSFYCKNTIINTDLTPLEMGLANNTTIIVYLNEIGNLMINNKFERQNPQKIINLIFRGKSAPQVVVQVDSNNTVGDALRQYLKKRGLSENNNNNYSFVFKGCNLNLNNDKLIKDITNEEKIFIEVN